MTPRESFILLPVGALYGALTRARLALYRSGLLSVRRVGAPVLSVGNITTGGTGKTPLVEWLARAVALRERKRVCILTRGYGREDERQRVVVSDGKRVLADARTGGDEPLLLAESLVGVAAVVCDADRAGAARWAMENLGSEVFILDDGFQHLRIARDLNILTVDATNPFGGGRLLPRGHLREPLKGIRRADLIVVTRMEQAVDIERLRTELKRLSGGRPVLLSRARTRAVRPLADSAASETVSADSLPQPVAAFCGIGNPTAFFTHLRNGGHTPAYTRAFPDHHVYTQADAASLSNDARNAGARLLLTTAKDAVKLRSLEFDLPCYVLEIELEFGADDEASIVGLIDKTLSTFKRPA